MIIEQLKDRIAKSEPTQQLISRVQSNSHDITYVIGAAGSLKSVAISVIYNRLATGVLCVVSTLEKAESLQEDLQQLLPDSRITLFEHVGRQALTEMGAAPSVIGKRLEALESLLFDKTPIVVCTANALTERIPTSQTVQDARFVVYEEDEVDFDDFISRLVESGFTREYMVDRPGEMSVRGGIVDIFPHIRDNPLRVEFFGDRIESIREFDVETQRSLSNLEHAIIFGPFASGFDPPDIQEDRDLDNLQTGTVLDYLGSDALLVLMESIEIEQEAYDYHQSLENFYVSKHQGDDSKASSLSQTYFVPWDEIEDRTNKFKRISIESVMDSYKERFIIDYKAQRRAPLAGNLKHLQAEFEQEQKLRSSTNESFLTAFLCESDSQKNRIQAIFEAEGLDYAHLNVSTARLSEGFRFLAGNVSVYTSHEFYGRSRLVRSSKAKKYGLSTKRLRSLKKGDFVVHVDHGIGRYQGLERISVWGAERECLKIEYRDKDHLYVPLEKMDRVQKHSSKEGYQPSLNKLGSVSWEHLKTRTKKRVKDIAQELIRLYALRKTKKGFAFSEDGSWLNELEASFVYDETPDQISVLQDIKSDMQSPRPMDRLICGDVGYGKTEVALRAAFKAITDSKQVAVLVPTTILAQQHYNTFMQRLERFPVKVEMLSRFRSVKQQKEIVTAAKQGKVDVLIGTHRILSKDIEFKDLGLLIVDEEQKFGVVHKERLKFLRSSIDVLTLTATPIPRTMHMALMGGRDMSVISTPPRDRHPIITEIAHFDKQLIREAILGEVARGGQIFFVHNRVQSIYAISALLRDLVPEVSFCVAHGQMRERELERVMIDFVEKKHHCLVSTMIIESGMDMPNVNTLIVNRADRFGLSQLYQLRGRVGRSTHQAYAYLLVPPLRKVSRDAIKRLQTIQEFTHLGSGYNIAMRDLEIRGTGNLLGAEQSGFMDALGFDLYCKIVNEAVEELKREQLGEDTQPKEKRIIEPIVKIDCDAFLPKEYVTIEGDRVDIYNRLVETNKLNHIDDIRDEIRDRFGTLPNETQNLLEYLSIKIVSQKLGISILTINDLKMEGRFDPTATPKTEQFKAWTGKMVTKAFLPFRFVQRDQELWFFVNLTDRNNKLSEAKKFLQTWL